MNLASFIAAVNFDVSCEQTASAEKLEYGSYDDCACARLKQHYPCRIPCSISGTRIDESRRELARSTNFA